MRRSGWIGALLLTAFGLYFSSGLLDVVGGASGLLRVAMLPPLWELAALAVVLGGVGFAGARTDRDPDVLLPLCAAALFVAPYLPWLPDRLPVLQALAGPVVGPFWGVLGYLVVSTAVSGRQWQIR